MFLNISVCSRKFQYIYTYFFLHMSSAPNIFVRWLPLSSLIKYEAAIYLFFSFVVFIVVSFFFFFLFVLLFLFRNCVHRQFVNFLWKQRKFQNTQNLKKKTGSECLINDDSIYISIGNVIVVRVANSLDLWLFEWQFTYYCLCE